MDCHESATASKICKRPVFSLVIARKKIADLIAAEMLTSIKQIDEEFSKNRTMHEMARAMHVITDTDNIAALSKALGRYNRLELDRAHSKLDAEIEVTNIYITIT